jgi:hypothetical protein
MRPIVDLCATLSAAQIANLPWNIRGAVQHIKGEAWRYLLDVAHFIRTHRLKAGKLLSFHARAVACIKKGKVGKDKEFGRVYQMARIAGNFLFVGACTSLRMNDKNSLVAMLDEHASLFGDGVLKSAAADKSTEGTGCGRYWPAASRQHQEPRRSCKCRDSKESRGPPCRIGGIDWTNQTWRATRSQQNEIRYSHIGCWVLVCVGFQSSATHSAFNGKSEIGGVIVELGKEWCAGKQVSGNAGRSFTAFRIVSGAFAPETNY